MLILLFYDYPFRISLCQQADLQSFYSFLRTKKLDFRYKDRIKSLFAKKAT